MYLVYKSPHNFMVPIIRRAALTCCLLATPACYSYQTFLIEKELNKPHSWITYPFHKMSLLASQVSLPKEKKELLDGLSLSVNESDKQASFWSTVAIIQGASLGFYSLVIFFTSVIVKRVHLKVSKDAKELNLLEQMINSRENYDTFFGRLEVISPAKLDTMLESFRQQDLVFEKFGWFGSKEETVKIKDLEKGWQNISLKALKSQLATLKSDKSYFYIDFDELKSQNSLFWYAFQSCVPWSSK